MCTFSVSFATGPPQHTIRLYRFPFHPSRRRRLVKVCSTHSQTASTTKAKIFRVKNLPFPNSALTAARMTQTIELHLHHEVGGNDAAAVVWSFPLTTSDAHKLLIFRFHLLGKLDCFVRLVVVVRHYTAC